MIKVKVKDGVVNLAVKGNAHQLMKDFFGIAAALFFEFSERERWLFEISLKNDMFWDEIKSTVAKIELEGENNDKN